MYGGCVLSAHGLLLKDSNVAADSADSDIFFAVIHLPARSKTYIKLWGICALVCTQEFKLMNHIV